MSTVRGEPRPEFAGARTSVTSWVEGLRRWAWRHPEWWSWALAAAAWAILIAADLAPRATGVGAHSHHAAMGLGGAVGGLGLGGSLAHGWFHWQLMVVAMMLPLMTAAVKSVAFRSFWRRRHRAVAFFLAGYLAAWSGLGLVVCALLEGVGRMADPDAEWQKMGAGLAFLAAAGWQGSRAKRRALVACHRTAPLAPRGLAAARDCFTFGGHLGGRCCVSCGLLMIACTLTGHALPVLLACAAIGYVERYSWRPPTRYLAAASVLLAALYGPWGVA